MTEECVLPEVEEWGSNADHQDDEEDSQEVGAHLHSSQPGGRQAGGQPGAGGWVHSELDMNVLGEGGVYSEQNVNVLREGGVYSE